MISRPKKFQIKNSEQHNHSTRTTKTHIFCKFMFFHHLQELHGHNEDTTLESLSIPHIRYICQMLYTIYISSYRSYALIFMKYNMQVIRAILKCMAQIADNHLVTYMHKVQTSVHQYHILVCHLGNLASGLL